MQYQIAEANGKLGVLLPGMGAVATTFIAGVEASKKGLAQPIGSLTQLGNIRLGKRTENRYPKIKDFVPLAGLEQIVFGGWDVYSDSVYEAASKAKVLQQHQLDSIKDELSEIVPMKAVFDHEYVKNLDGVHIKAKDTKYNWALALMEDIRNFKEKNQCERLVMVWCASTEKYLEPCEIHDTIEAFEQRLKMMIPASRPV